MLLVCEHASRFIPDALNDLGLDETASQEHIAWDIGALALAERLSETLGATLLSANYSRLLIDLNRPLHVPDSIPAQSEIYQVPGNHALDEATREYRQQRLFHPFHDRLRALIDQRLAANRPVRVVGIHSFTPVFYGQPRALEAGVLFGEAKEYAQHIVDGLSRHSLRAAGNQPYKINPLTDMTVPGARRWPRPGFGVDRSAQRPTAQPRGGTDLERLPGAPCCSVVAAIFQRQTASKSNPHS